MVTSFEEALPYSLHHTIKDTKKKHSFVYWLRVEGRNRTDCPDRMNIEVTLENLQGNDVFVVAKKRSFPFMVDAGEDLVRKLYPQLTFEGDPDGSFQVGWSVRRRPGDQLLNSGESTVRVRSKETFVWKLRAKPDTSAYRSGFPRMRPRPSAVSRMRTRL